MVYRLFRIFLLWTFLLSACQSLTTADKIVDKNLSVQPGTSQQPNYNYVVELPEGWTNRDTVMPDGLRIRFLLSPPALNPDYPVGNILVADMEGRNLDDFTNRNINYLKSKMPGVIILKRGNIDSSDNKGQWFTYTKEQNGVPRDMINYIIPLNGFAYMITFGTNKGSMHKYRATFDKIAKSFKG